MTGGEQIRGRTADRELVGTDLVPVRRDKEDWAVSDIEVELGP